MANEKILNTRIQLKYDTYTNWTSANTLLKQGEVAIATLAEDLATEVNATSKQPILMKVGPGNFNSLPWMSALAADVHAWAKKSEEEFKVWVKNLVPVEVIDNGTGKFVTDVTVTNDANGHHITITRDDAVNTLTSDGDGVVILTKNTSAKGDVTVNGAHKEYNGAGSTTDISSDLTEAGKEITIKVPSLTVDKYGHTVMGTETTHTIKLPGEIAVGDGNITIATGTGLTDGGAFNVNQDTDATITLNHQAKPTTGTAETATAGSGRTYVTEVLVDELGHIAGVKTATEADQNIQNEETPIAIVDKTVTDDEDTIYAVNNLVEGGTNGHKITPYYAAVPTKAYVDKKISGVLAGAVDYLGTVANAAELSAINYTSTPGLSHGDFVRVSAGFTTNIGPMAGQSVELHAGDLLIWTVEEGLDDYWMVIHGEMDKDTWTENTAANDGFVKKGQGQANKVWKTDGSGNPAWRDDEGIRDINLRSGAYIPEGIYETVNAKAFTVTDKDGNEASLFGFLGQNLSFSVEKGDDLNIREQWEEEFELSQYTDEDIAKMTLLRAAVPDATATRKGVVTLGANGGAAKYEDLEDLKDKAITHISGVDREGYIELQFVNETGVQDDIELFGNKYINLAYEHKDGTNHVAYINVDETELTKTIDSRIGNGEFTVSGTGSLTGSGSMTANQFGDTSVSLDIADKGVTTAKIADHAVGAEQTKACADYTGADAEVWVFNCGSATVNV